MHDPKKDFSVYLKAVSLFTNHQISFITRLHPNTMDHWIKVYELQGYEDLLSNHYGTCKSKLEAKRKPIL